MNASVLASRLCLLLLSLWLTACGGSSDSDTTPPPVVNTQPNPFSFASVSDAEPSTTVTSESISVTGINAAASIAIQNGEYSVNNGDFTSGTATVNNGAQIRVRHQTAAQYSTSTTSTLTIGGVSADFVSTTRDEPPPVGDGTPPQASVIFPWSQSKASTGTLRIRGTASSRNGISALSVNGVAATIQSSSASADRVSAQSVSAQSDEESDADEYEWTADVELDAYSDIELVVTVSDADGNQDDEAAKVRTNTQQAPLFIAYDAVNERLIGMMDNRDVVSIDLTDLSVEVIAAVGEASQFSLDAEGNRLFYSRYVNTTLYSFVLDLTSGEISTVASVQPELAEETHVRQARTRFDAVNQQLFVGLGLVEQDATYATDQLYLVDLLEESMTLLSASTEDDTPFLPIFDMVLHDNRLFALSQNGQLIEVDTITGERTQLMYLDNRPRVLSAGTKPEQLFIAGFSGIVSVDLTLLEAQMLSAETAVLEFPTAQIQDAMLLNNETLLITDSSFEVVLQVDTTSGERSALLSSGIGSGRGLLSPQYLTFGSSADILYVLDDGQNAAESLFAIDLQTGNRTQLIEIVREFNTYPSGLFYNAATDALLVGLSDAIWSVSLTDNSKTVISDAETESGIDIDTLSGGDFDTETQRLYMTQFQLENAILQINATNGARTLLEFDGSAGPAGVITGLNAAALDATGNQLFLASQSQSSIYRLDLETLETELLLDSCTNNIGQNVLDIDVSGIQKLNFDAADNRLLIVTSQIASYDLATSQCQIVGESHGYYNVLPLDNGTMLTTGQAALKQLDPVSQKQVILSK